MLVVILDLPSGGDSKYNKVNPMPTVLRVGRFRLVIFSNEGTEPPHIHVKSGRDEAKFWLDPIQLAANYGFKAHELHEIKDIVQEYHNALMEAWHEHLGG